MRLPAALLWAVFALAPTQVEAYPTASEAVSRAISIAPTCARAARPLMYASQAADILSSAVAFQRGAVEIDPWIRRFTGSNSRNLLGVAAGIAARDVLLGALSHRSPQLACAVEVNQAGVSALNVVRNLKFVLPAPAVIPLRIFNREPRNGGYPA
jgi:hypothetical protein